jgi:hypothetical protein
VTRKEITALLTQQYGLDTATTVWLASSFTVHADIHTGTAEFGYARLGFGTKVARDLVEDFGHQDLMYELQQINRILAKSQ